MGKTKYRICMIPATHLRLGNIVLRDGEYHVIDAYDILSASMGDIEFEPIPLEPEILVKCGFEQDKLGYSYNNSKFSIYYHHANNTGKYTGAWKQWLFGEPFYYLHQLQNLYFALTNEELIITL